MTPYDWRTLHAHRTTLRRCVRCGARLYPKQVQSIYSFKPPWKTCDRCRERERLRARAKTGKTEFRRYTHPRTGEVL
jgi:hypothetical protein